MPQRYYDRIRRKVLSYPRWLRVMCGIGLVIGGIFGFLPILGFWMIPLGLVVLSYDNARLRRWRRRLWLHLARSCGNRKSTRGVGS